MKTSLNPEQERAVKAVSGPLLILAGAGAGKTKTLTERIRHLIYSGVDPFSILAITFTNKAAREMQERVDKGLREDKSLNRPVSMNERPFVSTFHALGVHILREQATRLGIKRHFVIFDRDDSKKAIKEALEKVGLDPKTHEPARILGIISKEKGLGNDHSIYRERSERGQIKQVVNQIWPEYESILRRDSALDFDDLLLKTLKLLREFEDVRNYYRQVWSHIHVDEYQDTNRVQYEIVKLLVGKDKNICVVGDIDQNIYSWRGADIRNILDFEKDYPDAEVITLEKNYRSTKTILDAANTIIEKNELRRKKNLFTENGEGEKISLCHTFDETGEAEFVASKAEELIRNGTTPDEIAVLYRANFQSRVLEEAFMNRGIPYQLLGTKFFERKEVKDVVSYLRAALNPDSLSDLKRIINVPTRGIGKTTVLKIFSNQESTLPTNTRAKISNFRKILEEVKTFSEKNSPSETIKFIIQRSGLESEWRDGSEENENRLENSYELANFASRYDHLNPADGILKFLEDAALQSDQDEMRDGEKAVKLMTIHAAKGLEFENVFITGLEQGLFPYEEADESHTSQEEKEEERRLFYVALTRAKRKVYLSFADTRTWFGRRIVNIPSRFIFDIPETLIEDEFVDEYARPRKPLLEIEF